MRVPVRAPALGVWIAGPDCSMAILRRLYLNPPDKISTKQENMIVKHIFRNDYSITELYIDFSRKLMVKGTPLVWFFFTSSDTASTGLLKCACLERVSMLVFWIVLNIQMITLHVCFIRIRDFYWLTTFARHSDFILYPV